jgi:hypothetical protein
MLLALLAAQLGYSLSWRGAKDQANFTRASIGKFLAAVFLIVGIPWGNILLISWGCDSVLLA